MLSFDASYRMLLLYLTTQIRFPIGEKLTNSLGKQQHELSTKRDPLGTKGLKKTISFNPLMPNSDL